MLRSIVLIMVLISQYSYALTDSNQTKTSQKKQKLELTAKHLESTKATVKATEGVVVYYKDSVIKSNTALYNKETKLLTLDGNVEIIGFNGTKEHVKHMEIQTEEEQVSFVELFFVSDNDIWIYTKEGTRKKGLYNFGNSMLSSCDVNSPLWKMIFDRAEYDSDDKYMKIYNASIRMWDVPIFYTPYLAFSTNNERSSGLLFPMLGYSPSEGFIYEQPIFWAIAPDLDLEVNAQIRTKRSMGVYSTFRFVDSNHSSGKFRLGYFKDKASFTKEYDLSNTSHYGAEFKYESSKLFSDKFSDDYTDGLYVNGIYLNDVDYLNLQKRHLGHFGLSPLQESRINYFLHNNEYYFGMNTKYFIDTRKENNDETLQILPSFQWHKYIDTIFIDNLTYSVDVQTKNIYRKVGTTLKSLDVRVPIEYSMALFDNYLNISIGEEFYYSKSFFGNASYEHDSFQYYSNNHNVKLFTDLTKRYMDYIHVMQPTISYVKPGSDTHSPVNFSLLDDTQKELYSVGLPEEDYKFSLNNYIYDKKEKLVFYQIFSQKYYTDRAYKYSDIGNEMAFYYENMKFYNNMIYAPEFGKVRLLSSAISRRGKLYNFSLEHTYRQALDDEPNASDTNNIDFDFSYRFNERLNVSTSIIYDLDDKSSEQWKFALSYHRDCWNVAASIRQDITPRSTGYANENTFYLQFNFVPFGGFGTASIEK